ncbi:MAG: hypothetical protein KatS3mg108_2256 [Isosphaeraceae bacterium]|jgi:hypothetical protein|nr:MAG: hypothetical protein KatS3mg108_2256 [Isosphaeraceae bacterium]
MGGRIGAIGLGAMVAAVLPGCRWLPLQRPDAGLDPRAYSQVVANRALDPPALSLEADRDDAPPLPDLPLQPLDVDEALALRSRTPLLDEALERAEAIGQVVAEGAEPPRADPGVTLAGSAVAETDRVPPGSDPAPAAAPAESLSRPVDVLRPQPEEAWQVGMDALLRLAREQALREVETGKPGHWSAREQLLVRLAESDGTLWQMIVDALSQAEAAAAEAPMPPAAEMPRAPALVISELQICRRIEGFGVYEPVAAGELWPGRVVGVYWEVEGLRAEELAEGFRTRLESTIELVPATGGQAVWTRPLGMAEDLCRRPRRDYFVNARLELPAQLRPGNYLLRLTVHDALAGTHALRELPVTLQTVPDRAGSGVTQADHSVVD